MKYLNEGFRLSLDDVLEKYKSGETNYSGYRTNAFEECFANGHVEIAKYLMSRHDVKTFPIDKFSAFKLSCDNGHLSCVQYLTREIGLTREDVLANNNSALKLCFLREHLAVVKYLTEEFGLEKYSFPILTKCDECQYFPITDYLSDICGVEISKTYRRCAGESVPVFKYLVGKFGLTLEDIEAQKSPALTWSCREGHLSVIKYLMEEYSELNLKHFQKSKGLKIAFEKGHVEIVKYLKRKLSLEKKEFPWLRNQYSCV